MQSEIIGKINGCNITIIKNTLKNLTEKRSTSKVNLTAGEIMKQINKSSKDAEMFVLPSQLNGAEYPGPSDDAIVTNVKEQYPNDRTGGPRGQLACDLRVAQFICSKAANSKNKNGINYVRDMLKGPSFSLKTINVKNGYLLEDSSRKATQSDCKQFKRHVDKMSILLSENIGVTGMQAQPFLDPTLPLNNKSRKSIDLVYASAVPYGSYGNGTSNEWAMLCRTVLRRQYFLAITAAMYCLERDPEKMSGTYKIFFMPLGGGVFRNKFEWIIEALFMAISDAEESIVSKHMQSILEYHILCWDQSNEKEEFQKLMRDKFGKPKMPAENKGRGEPLSTRPARQPPSQHKGHSGMTLVQLRKVLRRQKYRYPGMASMRKAALIESMKKRGMWETGKAKRTGGAPTHRSSKNKKERV